MKTQGGKCECMGRVIDKVKTALQAQFLYSSICKAACARSKQAFDFLICSGFQLKLADSNQIIKLWIRHLLCR